MYKYIHIHVKIHVSIYIYIVYIHVYIYVHIYIYIYTYIHKILPQYTKHPLRKHGLVRNFHKVETIYGVFRVMGLYRFAWLGFADVCSRIQLEPTSCFSTGPSWTSWPCQSFLGTLFNTYQVTQWVGSRENLQEIIDFPMKYGTFL